MAERNRSITEEPRAIVMNAGNRTYTSPFELAGDDANLGDADVETAAEFEGDDVGGGNIAYGNAPRTSGAKLTGTKYSEPGR
jgi:hypothetical protein